MRTANMITRSFNLLSVTNRQRQQFDEISLAILAVVLPIMSFSH